MKELKQAYEVYKKEKEWERAYECAAYLYKEDKDYNTVMDLRRALTRSTSHGVKPTKVLDTARKAYFLTARDYFDDYMIAMEWERPLSQKFYIPRRRQLLPIVQEMQGLADNKLDLLCVSAPPGIGKTGLGDFFMTFIAGKMPDRGILMGSHSKSILNDNYSECLRMLSSDEYCWEEIFAGHQVVKTNAMDMKIDIDIAKKFSNLQFGSLGSGLAGRVRAQSLMFLDDLIPNIEVAMNKEQLNKIWNQYTTDFLQRMQGDCKQLMIATRWSVLDPIGRLEQANEGNNRARFISIPALNEDDESNFNYGGNIGFTTKHYHEIRKNMDDVSWRALYMNEPIEREGLLYHPDELKYYLIMPDEEPDGVYAVVDTKDTGSDYCVMPVAYRFGDTFYIDDFVCDQSLENVTTPRIISKCLKHNVKLMRIESNKAGGVIADKIQEGIRSLGGSTSVSKKYSTANKETRILVDSGWVKEHCIFKDKTQWDNEYRVAMRQLTGYALNSKNKNDDVADAMSMLANFVQSFEANVITVRARYI